MKNVFLAIQDIFVLVVVACHKHARVESMHRTMLAEIALYVQRGIILLPVAVQLVLFVPLDFHVAILLVFLRSVLVEHQVLSCPCSALPVQLVVTQI